MKTVLIVGASSGIGYACAKKFLREGYTVLNLSRTDCVLSDVINYLCDITDRENADKILSDILREHSEIHYLLYAAGCSVAAPLEYIQESDYRYLFEVNFFGFVSCLQRLLPALRHSFGTACVIGSIESLCPVPFDTFYASSKAALNAFIVGLQAELKPKNVRLISVLPNGTQTDFSYARKIYPQNRVSDYGDALQASVKRLEQIEQTGYAPERVASDVFRACIETGSPLLCSGFKTKLYRLAFRLLPLPLLLLLLKNHFLSPD